MRRRFYLVFNAAAGRSRSAVVDALIQALERRGAEVTRCAATTAEATRRAAHEAARSGDFDALVACGGDGTVRQVAAAAGMACAVGAVMLGTGNVLAHELGLPRDIDGMVRMLCDGALLPVQMGLANGDPFLLMAGAGLDGRIIANLDQRLKQRVAKLAYVPTTLKALAAPIDRLKVSLDGRTHDDVAWCIVTSARCYGGAFRLTTRTSLRQSGLVAVLLRASRTADLLRHGVALARGRLDQMAGAGQDDVVILSCRHAHIAADTPVPVQIDGDAFGMTPVTIDANGPHVTLIVP